MEIHAATSKHRNKLADYLMGYWKKRGMKFSVQWTRNYLKYGMTSEMSEERFVCVDDKDSIMGTIALLRYYEHVAEIRDEAWNDDRVGSVLLLNLIKYAKKKKTKKLYSLALKNKIHFYKKHGFVKEGLLKSHFKKGEDITIMSRFI